MVCLFFYWIFPHCLLSLEVYIVAGLQTPYQQQAITLVWSYLLPEVPTAPSSLLLFRMYQYKTWTCPLCIIYWVSFIFIRHQEEVKSAWCHDYTVCGGATRRKNNSRLHSQTHCSDYSGRYSKYLCQRWWLL